MKQELLAPAGDIQAAYAALFYGADALYLGLRQFSARATATNFSSEELCEITGYAHAKGAKIYVTINTLLQNEQLSDLILSLDACEKANVDGVIIQDLGVARVIKERYPSLQMHASTQMAVHNAEGAKALKKLGFTRVVLAREMTLQEIKKVCAIDGLETEAFIHGALCYAYSGLCLFSSLETGMSANRGKCLYPCRAEFDGELGKKHLFSMKDMALQEDVLKMPVTSLKIEGRKKNALYVAAVTNYYRRLLDKKPVDNLADDIRQIFARPWTKLHFNGKNKDIIDTDFVGHRGLLIGKVKKVVNGILTFKTSADIARYDGIQIDVAGDEKPFGFSLEKMRVNGKNVFEALKGSLVDVVLPPKAPFISAGSSVYLASSSKVKGAYHYDKPKAGLYAHRYPIDVTVKVFEDKIEAVCENWQAVIWETLSPAKDAEKVKSSIKSAFEKTGYTAFLLNRLSIENPQNLFVPMSLLNELRRQLYNQIKFSDARGDLPETTPVAHEFKGYIIKTDKPENLPENLDVVEFIIVLKSDMDLSALQKLPKNKVRLALPTVCRNPQTYNNIIDTALKSGYKKWEIGNVWALSMLPKNGIDLTFDNSIYVLNEQAVEMAKQMGAKRVTASFEDTSDNLELLSEKSSLPVVFVAYSDVPLFISANCVRENECKNCDGKEHRFNIKKGNEKYELLSVPCQTLVMNKKALYFGKEIQRLAFDYIRLDFMYKEYTSEQVESIFSAVCSGQTLPNTHTGNWQRWI